MGQCFDLGEMRQGMSKTEALVGALMGSWDNGSNGNSSSRYRLLAVEGSLSRPCFPPMKMRLLMCPHAHTWHWRHGSCFFLVKIVLVSFLFFSGVCF